MSFQTLAAEHGARPFCVLPEEGGAHRGAATAACGTGRGVPWGARLGHSEGRQAPGLTLAAVAQLCSPRLAWGQDGLAVG